jgi:hypothetical protein
VGDGVQLLLKTPALNKGMGMGVGGGAKSNNSKDITDHCYNVLLRFL